MPGANNHAGSFNSRQDAIYRLIPVFGKVFDSGNQRQDARVPQQPYYRVAQRRQHLRYPPMPDSALVLTQNNVSNPMQAILYFPMSPGQRQQPRGIGFSRRQAGDAVNYFDTFLSGFHAPPCDPEHLPHSRPPQIVIQQRGGLQLSFFYASPLFLHLNCDGYRRRPLFFSAGEAAGVKACSMDSRRPG